MKALFFLVLFLFIFPSFYLIIFSTPGYTILQHGSKGLVILLSASIDTVVSDTYYQSIGPYMEGYTIVSYSLPYHDRSSKPLEEWANHDMEAIVSANNQFIDRISSIHEMRPLILSGISRGGYLAARYMKADKYFLFSPVIDCNQLNEWKGKGKTPLLPTFKKDTFYYVYISANDNRVNGTFVIEYINNNCDNCTLHIGNTGHSVPLEVFEQSVLET